MPRYSLFILTFILTLPTYAGFGASVNIDARTVAAMTSAYAVEYMSEELNSKEIKKILDHYTSAEVATAGIFASKWLDRKALNNAGRFGNAERNYYYRRIYQLVSAQIMPKIYDVARLCIKYPDKALYWGPYLYKVCEDVKQLCMQFEVIVCNSKLTFQDIVFFCISDEFKEMFDLLQLGNVDWKALFEDMGDFGSSITKEDLMSDLDVLLTAGTSIASAGGSVGMDVWTGLSSGTKSVMSGKFTDMIRAYNEFENVYDLVSNPSSIKHAVMSKLGTASEEAVAKLLSTDSYNISHYLSDYISRAQGQYYKQRYYIAYKEENTETICNFTPNYNNLDGPEWILYNTSQSLTNEDFMKILENTEGCVGWSREKVNQLNQYQNQYTYTFNSTLVKLPVIEIEETYHYLRIKQSAYSYQIVVTRSMNKEEEVYSETFDSYNEDLNVFLAKMNAKVAEYNNNQTVSNQDESGNEIQMDANLHQYYLGCASKQYYTETDERKMQGCTTVSYTLNCDGENNLGDGNFSWKENGSHNHRDVRDDSRAYAMATSLSGSMSTAEIDARITELTQKVADLTNQVSQLNAQQRELLRKINTGRLTDVEAYRNQYSENEQRLRILNQQLTSIKKQLDDAQKAKDDLISDYAEEEDEKDRIPSVMHELETAYQITWKDGGSWIGDTYTRMGQISGFQGDVTFTALLKCTRGESHFLSIRTHRAILEVEWQLYADYSSSNVIEVMELDNAMSDSEKSQKANTRLHELMNEYPDCTVEMEYAYEAPTDVNDEDDSPHLLWVSDRLQMARDIEYRLAKIHADLILVHKFLYQRDNLKTYLLRSLFGGVAEGSRGRFGGQAMRRWRHAALHIADGNKPEKIEFLEDEN